MRARAHMPPIFGRIDLPTEEINDQTVAVLAEHVAEAYTHPRIRARVRQLFAGLAPYDEIGEVRAIYDWTTDAIRYQRDPLGTEHVTTPIQLDEEIDAGDAAEDCESLTSYAAALLAAAGYRPQFEAVGWNPTSRGTMNHLFLSVEMPDGSRVSLDPTAAQRFHGFALGEDLTRPELPRKAWNIDGTPITRGRAEMVRFRNPMAEAALGDINPADVIDALFKIGGGITQAVAPEFAPTIESLRQQASTAISDATRRYDAPGQPLDPYPAPGQPYATSPDKRPPPTIPPRSTRPPAPDGVTVPAPLQQTDGSAWKVGALLLGGAALGAVLFRRRRPERLARAEVL